MLYGVEGNVRPANLCDDVPERGVPAAKPEMNLPDSSHIPGMVEAIEQAMLFDVASRIALSPGDVVVEFGTFFGRSTHCLAEGLKANPNKDASNRLYAYDSFSCDVTGGFAKTVTKFATRAAIEQYLTVEGHTLSFRNVFEHYLANQIAEGVVSVVEAELQDSRAQAAVIALMHIDSPKYYSEFKVILEQFFPTLKRGAIVIFQDYFYQWSATLIAAVQLLLEARIISISGSAASSLLVEVVAPPTREQIQELDRTMGIGDIPAMIDRAMAACMDMTMDRKEWFFPRLMLSKVQYLWEGNQYPQAAIEFRKYLSSSYVNQQSLSDFLELMNYGFSLRKLYELDHGIDG